MYTPGGCGTDLAPASPAVALSGLGCPDCNGACGGGVAGLSMDGSGLFGTGIFGDSVVVTDVSTWGMAEYAAAAFGAYLVISLFETTKATSKHVRRMSRY